MTQNDGPNPAPAGRRTPQQVIRFAFYRVAREWLVEGLRKIERLDFLRRGGKRTLGQAALRFVLAEASVVSALPNIYDEKQLAEFAGASAAPDLNADELQRIAELHAINFGLPRDAGRKVEVDV